MNKHGRSSGLRVATLLSGRVLIQLISFISLPILTRLFLPEHFGVIQIFDSLSHILTAIVCLKYELSIPLARTDREALGAMTLAILVTMLFTLLLAMLTTFGKGAIASCFHSPELEPFLWLLPVIVLAGGIVNSLGTWAARRGQFGVIAFAEVGQSFTERLVSILLGLTMPRLIGALFMARVLGWAVRLALLSGLLRHQLGHLIRQFGLPFDLLLPLAKRHKKFALFTIWGAFLNTLSRQLPVFFLGAYYSKSITGYYSLAQKIVLFPMKMLSTSVAKVFFPLAAQEYNESGTLSSIVSSLYIRLLQIAVFPMTAITLFGPALFTTLLGPEWAHVGYYARMIAVWACITVLNAFQVFSIVNRQELHFLMNILNISVTTLGLAITVRVAPPELTLGIYVTITTCTLLIRIVVKLRLADVSLLRSFKLFAHYLLLSCALLVPAVMISGRMNNIWVSSGSLGGAALLYGILLIRMDETLREFFRKTPQRSP